MNTPSSQTRQRGIFLIEAALIISITMLMIVGGITLFQQAKLANEKNGSRISEQTATAKPEPVTSPPDVAGVAGQSSGGVDVWDALAVLLALKLILVAGFFAMKMRRSQIARLNARIAEDEGDGESIAGLAMQIDDLCHRHLDSRVVARGEEFCKTCVVFMNTPMEKRHEHPLYPSLIRSVREAHGLILKDVGRSASGRRGSSRAILMHLDRAIEAMSEMNRGQKAV